MKDKNLRIEQHIKGYATATAHPSLALIKYWGKQDIEKNIPATPSLAVTLDSLTTKTTVELMLKDNALQTSSATPSTTSLETKNPQPSSFAAHSQSSQQETTFLITPNAVSNSAPSSLPPGPHEDRIFIDGILQPSLRFTPFFRAFRTLLPNQDETTFFITARSTSDYPSSAGLASSAAGFAALVKACAAAASLKTEDDELSSIARIGSASAARSLFGGFVRLDAGAQKACPVKKADWWPNLRIIVVEVEQGSKPISSRNAMESVRTTSPFYDSWVKDAPELMKHALAALEAKNLHALGPLMRMSYLRMFGTMLSADPAILYWKPDSLGLIAACDDMRRDGLDVWETMDAGPQVKILCLQEDLEAVELRLDENFPTLPRRICRVGTGATIVNTI